MLIFEAFFRFGSIGTLCVIALLMWRDGSSVPAFRYALLLVLSVICLFLTAGSPALNIEGVAGVALRLIDMMVFVFVWWFGLALFDDDFRLGPIEWGVAIGLAAVMAPHRLHYFGYDVPYHPWMGPFITIATFLLMIHLVYRAILGRRDDLVERRRRVRVLFAFAIALLAVVSLLIEQAAIAMGTNRAISMQLTFLVTFFLNLWAILWLTRLHPEAFAFHDPNAAASAEVTIDAKDALVHQRLIDVMENDRAYAEHGLSIGDLAKRIDFPAHQLRGLINRSMGYRNFSAFLNHYRLREVSQSLADPTKARLPILTLALEAGFSSLAPFNRAFKAKFKQTPTQFRAHALKNHVAEADKSSQS